AAILGAGATSNWILIERGEGSVRPLALYRPSGCTDRACGRQERPIISDRRRCETRWQVYACDSRRSESECGKPTAERRHPEVRRAESWRRMDFEMLAAGAIRRTRAKAFSRSGNALSHQLRTWRRKIGEENSRCSRPERR